MHRVIHLALFLMAACPAIPVHAAAPAGGSRVIKIYKSATCGCCAKWVDHVKAAGFEPEVHDVPSVPAVNASHGVPPPLQSCHMALVGGYVIEGHVPADLIERLLKERPNVAGLAVPGMPAGSPGMEVGGSAAPYQVVAFTRDGQTTVYATR
jgi:hypothetical protein